MSRSKDPHIHRQNSYDSNSVVGLDELDLKEALEDNKAFTKKKMKI